MRTFASIGASPLRRAPPSSSGAPSRLPPRPGSPPTRSRGSAPDLTPLGGERAGNAEGTIPEWTGGITEPPAGYTVGEHHRDPFAGDRPLFVIDAGQPRRAPRPALGRAPAHAGDLPELPHAGLSHPAQRLLPATDLRRHPERRRHREARRRRQRRRRRGHRHPVPDSVQRPRGDLEPPAALPGRDGGVRHRPGRGHPRRRLHPGQAEPGGRASLLAAGHDARRARQHDDPLQAEDARAGASRGRHRAGARDHEPVPRAPQRMDLQSRPAPGAARSEPRLRQPRNLLGRACAPPTSSTCSTARWTATTGSSSASARCTSPTTPTGCTAATSRSPTS